MNTQAGFSPFVRRFGQGTNTALALHCTLAHSGAWRGIVESAGDHITLVAPDMPSHGRSADWDQISRFGETVYQASLAQLNEPMHIIGHSFGGAIGLRLALEHPELVRSLTMYEPVFFHIAGLDDPASLDEHNAIAAPYIKAMEQGDAETGARLFNRMWSEPGRPKWDDIPVQTRAALIRAVPVVPDTVDFLYEDSAGMMARLGTSQVPMLVMHGALSIQIIASVCSGLARRAPLGRDVVLENAGHMGPLTRPKDVARLWLDFMSEVAA